MLWWCRLILEGEEVVYGPDMVNKRQQMEVDFLYGTHIVEDPVGFTIRYTNWTAFPSQTPGVAFHLGKLPVRFSTGYRVLQAFFDGAVASASGWKQASHLMAVRCFMLVLHLCLSMSYCHLQGLGTTQQWLSTCNSSQQQPPFPRRR